MSWGNITDLPVLKYAAIQQATFAANSRGTIWTISILKRTKTQGKQWNRQKYTLFR